MPYRFKQFSPLLVPATTVVQFCSVDIHMQQELQYSYNMFMMLRVLRSDRLFGKVIIAMLYRK